jgi:uncharacterized protein YgiB involved in biofilm formation
MTPRNTAPRPLQPRLIRRSQVRQHLVSAAMIAALVAGCSSGSDVSSPSPSPSPGIVTDENAYDSVPAVFYENTQQCETDVKKQQDTYAVKLASYEQGTTPTKPTPPALKVEDCAPQMLAAVQEYEKTAPVYKTLGDCEVDGVYCEPTPTGYNPAGYRPNFGGSYFYPDSGIDVDYVYVAHGGRQHRVYAPRTVYQSRTPGQLVTPYGRNISKTQPGTVSVPRHTTVAAPPRPTGTAGRGTITGRSNSGFGTSFKSTGSGGK